MTRVARARAVALVTGATGGMGRVIALALARAGWHVVAPVRDASRAAPLLHRFDDDGLAGRMELLVADLSRREGILAVVREVQAAHEAVHLLVNNSGAHFNEHRLSEDGVEMHIAANYLASYGLTSLLRPELARGRARVVNVASDTLRDTRRVKLGGRARPATVEPGDLDDISSLSPKSGFVPFEAYGRAKLLTVTAGYGLARRLGGDGVTVNSVHPGIVATGIVDDLIPSLLRPLGAVIRRSMLTPEEGAEATLRLALDPSLATVTGRYFVRDVDTPTPPVTYDLTVQDLLLQATDRFFAREKA